MNSIRSNQSTINLLGTKQLCYHCGDDCPNDSIAINEKLFCCDGCKMVYQILNEYDLQNYYQLNEHAGSKQKNRSSDQFDYLEDENTVQKLIDFEEGNITKVHFTLPQIHCSSCLWLLEHLYRINLSINSSVVDFVKKEVFITYRNDQITLKEVVQLLDKIGYQPLIRLNDLDQDLPTEIDKSLYYKLGLAGFSFGNIMLMSFPEYLGIGPEQELTQYFSYLNFALILPVLLYSGLDYFKSALQGIRQKHLNIDVPIALGITALFLRSSYEIFTHTGAGYLDSLAGLIFFLLIGKWIQQRTYKKISFDRDYKSYFPIAARVIKDENETQLSLDQIEKGHQLRILNGELIPADGILINGSAYIDYSFVTGESEPIRKQIGDQLYAGGRQMGESISMMVSKEVSNSYLTKLWNHKSFEKKNNNDTASVLANKVGSIFTWLILFTAFSTLFYWMSIDSGKAINAFTAVLIIACPCAVALSIPFTFSNMIRVLGNQHIYMKNISVVEALVGIDTIVFDKTGTITDGKKSKLLFSVITDQLTALERQYVHSLAEQSIHPLSQMVVQVFSNSAKLPVSNFEEIKGEGIQAKIDGHWIHIGSEDFFVKNNIPIRTEKTAATYLAIDQVARGFFIKEIQYKQGLKKLLFALKRWSALFLLSGDNNHEAKKLGNLFPNKANLFFQKKPDEKLAFIKDLQQSKKSVCMIGDGLNDAGALSQSNVGIVITENSSNFTPACDVIIDASAFNQIQDLFKYAKDSLTLVYCAYGIALVYNIIGLSFAVRGELSPVIAAILMPLSSVSIVIFGVIGSSLLAYKNGFRKK